ncbi:MAG TPA: segregation/condensation protein A [Candidatus Hydrogenedentes bacterium]|nr:segregation/condensation protein A [Candidatus Hydrogenedentota bacterium]HOS02343.1 segregation/condensation protein A [Candidatus Hydrogenedentota bacterium]
MANSADRNDFDAILASGEEPASIIVDDVTDEVLKLHLEQFEGPFEVLLYLIKVQEIDIFDIPVVTITEQYLRFLDMMREESLDITGDFLVMAATLIQIKSKMLLPVEMDTGEEEVFDEEDPRIELVEKLIEYRRYRDIAARLQFLEAEREKRYARRAKPEIEPDENVEEEMIEVSLYDLIASFRAYLRFFSDDLFHTVESETHSVDEKIDHIEQVLGSKGSLSWSDLLGSCRSRIELVCCFLAILELCRMGRLRAHQHGTFDEIRLFAEGSNAQRPEAVLAGEAGDG